MKWIICIIATSLLLTGCASYKRTLTNSKGETITCEASGKNGIITGIYLRKGFNNCINEAKSEGFKEVKIPK